MTHRSESVLRGGGCNRSTITCILSHFVLSSLFYRFCLYCLFIQNRIHSFLLFQFVSLLFFRFPVLIHSNALAYCSQVRTVYIVCVYRVSIVSEYLTHISFKRSRVLLSVLSLSYNNQIAFTHSRHHQ